MKTTTLATIVALLATPVAFTAEDHDHGKDDHHEHEENVASGPNGGHVISSKAGFSFEVTVDKERKARVIFLDKDNKPVWQFGDLASLPDAHVQSHFLEPWLRNPLHDLEQTS